MRNNIFSKLKEFIIKIFKKDKVLELQESAFVETNKKVELEDGLDKVLKKEMQDYENKSSIIETVNTNPDVLENLTTERLIQLNQMYDEKIAEARRELEELKRKINQI